MSAAEGLPAPPTSLDPADERVAPGALPALCPYLATIDGDWRSATAIREHRCMAVAPPVPLAIEKQRRLCLVVAHKGCSTYGAAETARAPGRAAVPSMRPIARMTPVILDHGRFEFRMPSLRTDRTAGQAVLVVVLGIALTAILIARPSAGAGAAADSPSASPAASPIATTDVTVASPAPTTPAPTEAASSDRPTGEPSPAPTSGPTARPSTSAAPVTSGATYKVKSGDTLSAIAARFDTTVRVLVDLNGITDPSRLRVGQILNLP